MAPCSRSRSNQTLPAITSWIPCASKSADWFFMKIPEMPFRISCAAAPCDTPAVTTRIFPRNPRCLAARTNSVPWAPPRSKSSRTMSTRLRASTSSPSSIDPQWAMTSSPVSWFKRRVTLSRKSAWSSIRRMEITAVASLTTSLLLRNGHGQDDRETSSPILRFKHQIAAKAPHNRTGNVQTETSSAGSGLKRPEELFRETDPCAGIGKANHDTVRFAQGGHAKFLFRRGEHGAFAVRDEIEKHLYQAKAVGPNQRQRLRKTPLYCDSRVTVSVVNQHPQLIEHLRQAHRGNRRSRRVANFFRGDFGQALNQRVERTKVFTQHQTGLPFQVFIDYPHRGAHVMHFMRHPTHQDAGIS